MLRRLLREYFGLEFASLQLPFPLDVERIIDDFVLFCMFTGNDFLPRTPHRRQASTESTLRTCSIQPHSGSVSGCARGKAY